ncbi:MarR family winged helix-turn-helix transcriptional regulator [Flexivirga meconopsidis]|uniref:MarR family winged helix-turn-helix transcriptional regulator n=1 Tax=Flexivirga meconopsidis TaxID=2977121 RepID=UPI002449D815|nr:MarR family transcriptional regulator [Flexivirga meconopsidis]
MTQVPDEPTLGQLVQQTARALRRANLSELEPYGLSPSQSRALGVVSRHGADQGLRLSTVAEHLDIAPRSATEVIDALEERGLVHRTPDPADRRAVLISLTDEGHALRRRLERARARRSDEIFGSLTSREQQSLRELLRRVLDRK